MVGLPRSGKSTKALRLGYPIVCPDALREVIHGTPFKPDMEPMVWAIAHLMVSALFAVGHTDVILDACNHTEKRRNEWLSKDWAIQYHVMSTPISVCIDRARATKQEYLIPVIERMSRDYEEVGGRTDC